MVPRKRSRDRNRAVNLDEDHSRISRAKRRSNRVLLVVGNAAAKSVNLVRVLRKVAILRTGRMNGSVTDGSVTLNKCKHADDRLQHSTSQWRTV